MKIPENYWPTNSVNSLFIAEIAIGGMTAFLYDDWLDLISAEAAKKKAEIEAYFPGHEANVKILAMTDYVREFGRGDNRSEYRLYKEV